jgi:nucleoside permease NupC
MPVLIFFSSMINVLYHYGIVQYFILKVSWFINIVMGTSPTESVTATANIFLGTFHYHKNLLNLFLE